MAKHGMYVLFDSKVAAYASPFFCVNDAVAKRCVVGALRDSSTSIAQNPGDFSVHTVGVYDDVSGAIEPVTPPRFVASVASLVVKPELELITNE